MIIEIQGKSRDTILQIFSGEEILEFYLTNYYVQCSGCWPQGKVFYRCAHISETTKDFYCMVRVRHNSQGTLNDVIICQPREAADQPFRGLCCWRGEEASHWKKAQSQSGFCAAAGQQSWRLKC